jgi:5-methylcytosine-specific restriction endonuclease McrA
MPKIQCECIECGRDFEQWASVVKRTGGKFCSISCGVKNRNLRDGNPACREEVRAKISKNHADVSGEKNPMYGRCGRDAPGYIDGRNSQKRDAWRRIALENKPHICERCGDVPIGRNLHVHHVDGNRKNNALENLMILCVKCHNNHAHPRERDELGRFKKGGRGR